MSVRPTFESRSRAPIPSIDLFARGSDKQGRKKQTNPVDPRGEISYHQNGLVLGEEFSFVFKFMCGIDVGK